MQRRQRILFLLFGVLAAVLFVVDLSVGAVPIPIREVLAALTGSGNDPVTTKIILNIRLLKAVVALLAGAALAVSGLQMQTLFRNPLAGPYVLGISSGASLGVAIFLLGAPLLGLTGHPLISTLGIAGAAWIGSALILMLIAAVSRRIKDIMVILILGMMFSSGVGAVVQILQYLSNEAALKSFVVWTMGSLGDVTLGQFRSAASCRRSRTRAGRRGHQTSEPAPAGRKLRPHDGTRHPPFAAVDLPLHHPAGRYGHRFLRPDRIHRPGRPARRPHSLRRCRPSDSGPGLDPYGHRGDAPLRRAGQTPHLPHQHDHGAIGHPHRHLGRHP